MARQSPVLRATLLALLLVAATAPAIAGLANASSGSPPGQTGPGTNGTLSLSVTPTTAAVRVNGSAVALDGSGSATVSLAPGTYLVSAAASRDESFQGNVTIVAGQTAYLTVHLVASPGTSSGRLIPYVLPLSVLATIVGAVVIAALAVLLLRPGRRATSKQAPPPVAAPRPPEQDEGPV